jgi:3-oxoacyl-[acyl-carrier protein] reductase
MELGLRGKTAVITGGTRGIGRAIAFGFAAEGCDVGICARTAEQVADTVTALEATGIKAAGDALDVADGEAVRRWIAHMNEAFGGFDIFVANVSAQGTINDEPTWRRSVDVDILGTVNALNAALPVVERSDAGAVVMIITSGAVQVFGPPTPYPAVKAANLAYMKYLSAQYAPRGVRINAVSPGSIYFEGGVWDRRRQNEPERYERMLKLNPMGRFGKPEEIANAVVFLASPASAFTAGTNLVVDGASTVRIQN